MEDLILQLENKKIHEDAVAAEKIYYTKTDRTVNPKKENTFKYIKGTIPVLVSAPHSVRHLRQKKIKQSDIFTGSLAHILNSLTDCHALSVTRLYGGDPNFDLPCLYKNYLKDICQANKIHYLIDLHGAAADKDFDIDMGTMHGQSLLNKPGFEKIIRDSFSQFGINQLSLNQMPAIKQNSITKFASQELGIPSVQLEINRKFRAPNQNPNAYCRLIAALTVIISHCNH